MTYKLIEHTDQHMVRPSTRLPRPKTFYPSEASAVYTDHHGVTRTIGQCLRQSYYRLKNIPPSEPSSPYSQWIFALGKAVEEILVEQWKQMGIWVDNNVKFYDPERNISGEIDVLLREPDGRLYCVEVKSFYNYYATKEICGSKTTTGRPKDSQLMQALIYTDLGIRLGCWEYVKMVYYARDSAARAEFDITLTEDGGLHRPTINGSVDFRFTMEDIYARYADLANHLEHSVVPPRDYQLAWDAKKVAQESKIGNIAKTKLAKYKSNPAKNPIGDWNCSYCAYKTYCQQND